MKNKVVAATMGAALLLVSAAGGFGAEEGSHEVVRGDTLWAISRTYLADPLLWPAVWRQNPAITNPHLIYPRQLINLPGSFTFNDGCGEHLVVTGDTLWWISGRYLKDSFLWPVVWRTNPYITNPHLILPGQRVKIPCLAEEGPLPEAREEPRAEAPVEPEIVAESLPEVTEPEVEPIPAPADINPLAIRFLAVDQPVSKAPVARTMETLFASGLGTVVPVKPAASGLVIGQDRGYTHAGVQERVRLDLDNPRIGKSYGVYRNLGLVRHPVTNKKVGHMILDVGIVVIDAIRNNEPLGLVDRAFQVIRSGDYLGPVPEMPKAVASEKDAPGPAVSGTVIALHQLREMAAGAGSLLYLDVGSAVGLTPGARLSWSAEGQERAEIMVLRVTETTATAVVEKSGRPIVVGGKFQTARPR